MIQTNNQQTKRKYVDNQSYLHRKAVSVLANWLRAIERSKKPCKFGQLAWRKNQGVFTELKFHENNSPFYFEHPPLIAGIILFVPDIVIFHQGYPKYIIEVVHTNPPTNDKLFEIFKFFHDLDTEVYTIHASYIMRHTKKPKTIEFLKAA